MNADRVISSNFLFHVVFSSTNSLILVRGMNKSTQSIAFAVATLITKWVV